MSTSASGYLSGMAQLNRPARYALATLLMVPGAAFADGPRVPISGTPRIAGQVVEAVVLLEAIDNIPNPGGGPRILGITIPPGPFKPVAQDRDGYYFQAKNTIQPYKGGHVDYEFFKTGLYLSKSRPGEVFVYFGDPLRNTWLAKDLPRLTPKQVTKLRLGKIQRSDSSNAAAKSAAKKP